MSLTTSTPSYFTPLEPCAQLPASAKPLHGVPKHLPEWAFKNEELSVNCQCRSPFRASCSFTYLWPMGCVFCRRALSERLSARRRKGKCPQGAEHWRYVVPLAMWECILRLYVEGELQDLIEEFSDGRIQFAFLKIKDPNTTLPKNILISWVQM